MRSSNVVVAGAAGLGAAIGAPGVAVGQPGGDPPSFYAFSARDRTLHTVTVDPVADEVVGTLPLPASLDLSRLAIAGPDRAFIIDRDSEVLYTIGLSDATVLDAVQLDRAVWVTRRGLAVSPDGVLWGVLPGLQLRTIDPLTGSTTLIAPITGATIIEDIAFSPDGDLYAVGNLDSEVSRRLYTMSKETGVVTEIARLPINDIDSLTWGSDGFLYGTDAGAFRGEIFRIDPVSGALDALGTTSIFEIGGLDAALGVVCRADLDGDGDLTIFDFLAFQNAFDAGDPSADFDGDGDLTIFDFLAFQNAFDLGCP